jgi:transposase-like protein
MLLAPSISGLFKWRQFEPEVILLAVGWNLRFSLSYREVEELLAERGLWVDHVIVWRWVQLRPGVAAAFTPAPQADER